jgi:hypothetical protein
MATCPLCGESWNHRPEWCREACPECRPDKAKDKDKESVNSLRRRDEATQA